ncbi:MAG: hypothetical protein VB861_06930, partial [Planctomycetaceae bacterium]
RVLFRSGDQHSTETESQPPQDDANAAAESVDDFQIEEWTDSTSAADVQLPDDDVDILDLTTTDTAHPTQTQTQTQTQKPKQRSETRNKPKRRRKPATPKSNKSGDDSKQQPTNRQNLKPPPLPPGLDSVHGTGSGEDEFWSLPES